MSVPICPESGKTYTFGDAIPSGSGAPVSSARASARAVATVMPTVMETIAVAKVKARENARNLAIFMA